MIADCIMKAADLGKLQRREPLLTNVNDLVRSETIEIMSKMEEICRMSNRYSGQCGDAESIIKWRLKKIQLIRWNRLMILIYYWMKRV